MTDPVAGVANALMRAVARTKFIRHGTDHYDADVDVACRVIREELKAFLLSPQYADERAIVMTGGHSLAFASLAAECVRRIAAERAR